jgi:hypothetical protein
MDEITLPEITIVGDPEELPITVADWWAAGFVAGYNAPDIQHDRPLLINEDLATVFAEGVNAGQRAANDRKAELDAELADQPQIGPDIGGESFEKAQEDFDRLLEDLFHRHPPHTDPEHMEEGSIPTGEFNRPEIRPVID